jgi:hypothetical protein
VKLTTKKVLSKTKTYKWHKCFQNGRTSMVHDERFGLTFKSDDSLITDDYGK